MSLPGFMGLSPARSGSVFRDGAHEGLQGFRLGTKVRNPKGGLGAGPLVPLRPLGGQLHQGCMPQGLTYITLNYIALHYITLHYIIHITYMHAYLRTLTYIRTYVCTYVRMYIRAYVLT